MTASFADNEIWHVLVASDDMKRMNVDQLDDAFRLDIVDASTLVWKAGMRTWQRLGSIAGIEEDEPETITKQMTPETLAQLMPMHPPPPLPRPRSLVPKPPRPAHTQQFAAPLVATPMYVPQLHAPDPYVLPKRRVSVPSEVDFRRRSGGVRLGRWLVGLLIVTTGVLVCYRQNLLREGARRVGIENKYLYGEKRALSFVTAKAPRSVQNVLTRLSLLPGPNAAPAVSEAPAPRAPEPSVTPPVEAAKAPPRADSDVKTVSLDSLPVLGAEPAAATVEAKVATLAPKAQAPRAAAVAVASKPAVKAEPRAKKAQRRAEDDEPAPKPKAKQAEPPAEPEEPKVAKQAAPPPPSGNESFLKAAIRSAIAADKGK